MEHLLLKLARQLDALDEASLMSLWNKYATAVSRFEPTKRWEEATLIFSLIQAKRWKNQLFNYNWATQLKPQAATDGTPPAPFSLEATSQTPPVSKQRCKILSFRPVKSDETT